MQAIDIHKHFQDIGTWVDWDRTTDTFKAGDPQRDVRRVAVAWKANWDALRQAADGGAEIFISHESICVKAVNGSPEPDAAFAMPSEMPKFRWLEETELVVYRCHDVWDRVSGIGIRDSWQKGLDLGGEIVGDGFPLLVTRIDPMALGELARHIVRRIRDLGQTGVCVAGDPERKVSRIATGTGVSYSAILPL